MNEVLQILKQHFADVASFVFSKSTLRLWVRHVSACLRTMSETLCVFEFATYPLAYCIHPKTLVSDCALLLCLWNMFSCCIICFHRSDNKRELVLYIFYTAVANIAVFVLFLVF